MKIGLVLLALGTTACLAASGVDEIHGYKPINSLMCGYCLLNFQLYRIRLGLTCKDEAKPGEEGSCKVASKAVLEVCGGICREYYPQIRFFLRDHADSYHQLSVSTNQDQTGDQPFIEFFDSSNVSLEKVEIGGMFSHEMEEELQARGIRRKS